MNVQKYFKNLEREVKKVYIVAEEARKRGLDPVNRVEIPLAMTMAEKVVGLISAIYPQLQNSGITKRILELEKEYAYDACPRGLLGINAEQFCDYVGYIADRRLERIGLPKIYSKENPFPWLSQSTDLSKEKNFFETRVTEYRHGGDLVWNE